MVELSQSSLQDSKTSARAGKSTILNGLLGEARFKSGLSAGTGMTFKLDKYTTDTGVIYADTPGLSDTEKRRQAAKVITEALKLGGNFRIFFVVRLTQGRVMPEDVTTMKLVLEAAPITSYGIILNQLSRKEYANMNVQNAFADSTAREFKEKVFLSLLTGLPSDKKTLNIWPMKRDDDLDGEDNMVKPLPRDVQQFILSLPPVVIKPHDVQWVRADAFDKERERLNRQLMLVQESNQRQAQAQKEMEKAEMEMRRAEAESARRLCDAEVDLRRHQQKLCELECEVARAARERGGEQERRRLEAQLSLWRERMCQAKVRCEEAAMQHAQERDHFARRRCEAMDQLKRLNEELRRASGERPISAGATLQTAGQEELRKASRQAQAEKEMEKVEMEMRRKEEESARRLCVAEEDLCRHKEALCKLEHEVANAARERGGEQARRRLEPQLSLWRERLREAEMRCKEAAMQLEEERGRFARFRQQQEMAARSRRGL